MAFGGLIDGCLIDGCLIDGYSQISFHKYYSKIGMLCKLDLVRFKQ